MTKISLIKICWTALPYEKKAQHIKSFDFERTKKKLVQG